VKKKILRCLVVTCAVRTHRRLLSSDAVKTADQKRAVARPQLGNSDALASEPAESPVELWTDVCHESVVVRIVRVTKLAGVDLLCSSSGSERFL